MVRGFQLSLKKSPQKPILPWGRAPPGRMSYANPSHEPFMANESKFSLRWKRPSPAFMLVIVITVVGLFAAFALPGLILPKFVDKPTGILFRVHVLDDQGIPIPNATVTVGSAVAQTDLEGSCDVLQEFLAKGIKGLTGTCRLDGTMRVDAPGYSSWKGSLPDLFGRNYDYFTSGTNISHEVTLLR